MTGQDMTAERLYAQHISQMPPAEQKKLLEIMMWQLIGQPSAARPADDPQRSVMELHGLGAEIWQSADAQEYVEALREEWKHRP
jgi:hypothetical protein